MSILIERDEGTAARRRVPCRIFTSNGTAPDTGAVDDAVIMGVGSLTTISLSSTLRIVHAAQGMYAVELTASEVSVLGTHPLYHTVGDFPQHIATVQVVAFNPFSSIGSLSTFNMSASDHSVRLLPGVEYSSVSVRLGANAIYDGAHQAGAIDAAALAAMTLSDVTVRVQPIAYSGMTVGIDNATGDVSSRFTVAVSTGTVTGVTNRVTANTDQLNGSAAAVLRLVSHISSVVTGQAVTGQLSTTSMTADVAEATNDHFNGRIIIWTTGVLLGQATSINTASGYIGFSATSSRFHFVATTEAPANGDAFVVV